MERSEIFQTAWQGLGAEGDPGPVLQEIEQRWSEPHRHYHTLAHLDHCLQELESVRETIERPEQVFFSAFAHDVVQDPRRWDNETRSAEWALQVLEAAGVPADVREAVAWQILATRHDGLPPEPDVQLLADADLAILGQDPERFEEYEQQIREEHRHLPRIVYRAGRARLLRHFLRRPALYLSETFRDRYEEKARANLENALKRLESLKGRLGL